MAETTKSPTCWKRPSDVMKLHNLKMKKRALQARMDNSMSRSNGLQILNTFGSNSVVSNNTATPDNEKQKNPFKLDLSKRFKSCESPSCDLDASNDNTLFQLLHQSGSGSQGSQSSLYDSFTDFLGKVSEIQSSPVSSIKKKQTTLPNDWSLKSRLRFFSKKAFMWGKTLKTLEEASGTTGFSRCLDLRSDDCGASPSLDTGANAQFHQCCLVWQHPSLPWLSLFPRSGSTTKATNKTNPIPIDAAMRECLHKAWRESFRSLLQLVRSHQCPYFYVCANRFSCLFRAAGIGGIAEIHALITPTTSGFRGLLQKDEVVYSMPLRKEAADKKSSTSPSSGTSPPDLGYNTQDSLACSPEQGGKAEVDSDLEGSQDEDEEGEEEAVEWLQSMGVGAADIKRMNSTHSKKSVSQASQLDQRPASMVLVEKDEEVQALFNLLLNCQSIISTTGPLAGIPPTLLAPIAFQGATLRKLTTSHRVVNMSGEQFQCVELSGPVLPHTLRDLCSLLEPVQPQFSVSCSTVEHTRAFSLLPECPNPPVTDVFSRENLRDCGLHASTLHSLCQPPPAQVLESVKFSDDSYLCEN
ncbi:hypothetical protein B566_EDAN008598 [Ephemera danica]|nr:hypothetical protein B566_EDAN008598 [Ephemera danica]